MQKNMILICYILIILPVVILMMETIMYGVFNTPNLKV